MFGILVSNYIFFSQLNGQNVSILQSQLTPQQIAAFQSQTQQYANSPQAVAGIRPGTALLNVNVGNQNVAGLQNVQLLGMCRSLL